MTAPTTTAPATAPFFRTQRPGDVDAMLGQDIRDGHWAFFSRWAEPDTQIEDFDLTVARLMSATGLAKNFLEKMILAHAMLQRLPQLRALQAATRIMDSSHLMAMEAAICELGPDIEPEVWEVFDELLTKTFTPQRRNQETPKRNTVTARIRSMIKLIDPTRAYDPEKREKRLADTTDGIDFGTFNVAGVLRGSTNLVTDTVTLHRIRQHLLATAREQSITLAEAAIQLLTGEITPATAPTINLFSPRDRKAGEPMYIPGFGWTDPAGTAALDAWLENAAPKIVDLDEAAGQTTASYTPTPAMRKAVEARDGCCIFPGCSRPAESCQLDHRIPFNQGGETTPGNLFALCAHHHNMKTDKRVFYLPDPETGEIVWLFPDGTYEISEQCGVIFDNVTPTNPRWRTSLAGVQRNRAIAAEFNAKGHKILDEFDRDKDLEKANSRIEALEQEYGMEFPVKAVLPDPPPLPEEPAEPTKPDPEEYYNQNPETIESAVEAMLIELMWKRRAQDGDAA